MQGSARGGQEHPQARAVGEAAGSGVQPIVRPIEPVRRAGQALGEYQILGCLASGGMASVYLGRRTALKGFERLFAVKILHPQYAQHPMAVEWFLSEARIAALIRHPNVIGAVDVSDTPEAGYFLVMDYVPGDHLSNLLRAAGRQRRRIRVSDVLRIISDLLSGLGAAHRVHDEGGNPLGLIHRDLSPHNVMVGSDGVVRLTDFGVAVTRGTLRAGVAGSARTANAGKLAYMSPEQALGAAVDHRSDLFSVGTLLWESLVGKRLFAARRPEETTRRLCRMPVPAPSTFHSELAPFDAISLKALARSPRYRFQDTEEFADALETVAVQTGGFSSQRTLGRLVAGLAADKLARERSMARGIGGAQSPLEGTSVRPRAVPPPVPGAHDAPRAPGMERPHSAPSAGNGQGIGRAPGTANGPSKPLPRPPKGVFGDTPG